MRKLSEVLHYYLPYGLMCKYQGQINEEDSFKMIGIDVDWVSFEYTDTNLIEDVFPLLKPISSFKLNEENINYVSANDNRWIRLNDIPMIKFKAFQYLIENHFDVFGLIASDQAIDKTK